MMEGPGAESEEKREPASDTETAAADSLKVLDPERPIREVDMAKPIFVRVRRTFGITQCRAYSALAIVRTGTGYATIRPCLRARHISS